jgi:hypothetical protein
MSAWQALVNEAFNLKPPSKDIDLTFIRETKLFKDAKKAYESGDRAREVKIREYDEYKNLNNDFGNK